MIERCKIRILIKKLRGGTLRLDGCVCSQKRNNLAGQEETKRLSFVYRAGSRHMTKERYVGPLENNGVCPSRTSLEA